MDDDDIKSEGVPDSEHIKLGDFTLSSLEANHQELTLRTAALDQFLNGLNVLSLLLEKTTGNSALALTVAICTKPWVALLFRCVKAGREGILSEEDSAGGESNSVKPSEEVKTTMGHTIVQACVFRLLQNIANSSGTGPK